MQVNPPAASSHAAPSQGASGSMKVFLTGGTGFIGSGVLRALLAKGHQVTALARSTASARALGEAGAAVVQADLADTETLVAAARAADGVVHAGSPGDSTSPRIDAGVVDAFLYALADSGKPYVHTSGIWIYGSGDLHEGSPYRPQDYTAWRLPLDARVRTAAADGIRSVVIAPGIVYGHGRGLANVIRSAPTEGHALRLPGTGKQHWATVHTDDLGRLYELALTQAAAGSYYLGVSGQNPTVRQIGEAASRSTGGDGRVRSTSPAEAAEIFGSVSSALLLDQRATGAKARLELGWRPTCRSLLEDLERDTGTGREAVLR